MLLLFFGNVSLFTEGFNQCLVSSSQSSKGYFSAFTRSKHVFRGGKTTNDLTFARNIRRYDPRNIRTACGERPVTTPTGHPSSPHQTTGLQEKRSSSPGASGQDGPNPEIGALPCPGRRSFCGFHRELFGVFCKRTSKAHSSKPRLSPETITLIKEMAANNRLWGAERIHGELLKLDMRVWKRTLQKYIRHIHTTQPRGQNWRTFLRTHAAEVWACDFPRVTDLFFRSLFAFFIIELQSRKVIHVHVTGSPTDPWVAQQLREATPYGQRPNSCFEIMTANSGRVLHGWQQQAASKDFERRTELHEPMPSANALWGA